MSKSYLNKPVIIVSNDDSEIKYKVINKTKNGFEIELTTPNLTETSFNWIALGK
jgi:hypothetical protein